MNTKTTHQHVHCHYQLSYKRKLYTITVHSLSKCHKYRID